MILNDKQIKKLVNEEEMINPFVSKSISKGISHGLNSFGYDLRCGAEFKIFTNIFVVISLRSYENLIVWHFVSNNNIIFYQI